MNGEKHGKGILYDVNGSVEYEGDFVNGKMEGKGKLIYGDGSYYEGQFSDNKRNGKGIIYSKNGDIIYEGDYVNNEQEGIGKFLKKMVIIMKVSGWKIKGMVKVKYLIKKVI